MRSLSCEDSPGGEDRCRCSSRGHAAPAGRGALTANTQALSERRPGARPVSSLIILWKAENGQFMNLPVLRSTRRRAVPPAASMGAACSPPRPVGLRVLFCGSAARTGKGRRVNVGGQWPRRPVGSAVGTEIGRVSSVARISTVHSCPSGEGAPSETRSRGRLHLDLQTPVLCRSPPQVGPVRVSCLRARSFLEVLP